MAGQICPAAISYKVYTVINFDIVISCGYFPVQKYHPCIADSTYEKILKWHYFINAVSLTGIKIIRNEGSNPKQELIDASGASSIYQKLYSLLFLISYSAAP